MVRAVDQESDLPLFRAASRKFLSVSELNELIKGTLESQLDGLWAKSVPSCFAAKARACASCRRAAWPFYVLAA
jgi:hypothetical protein